MDLSSFDVQVLWGVSAWRLVVAALLIFVGFAARRIVIAVFKGWLLRKAEKTEALWDDEVVKYTPGPVSALAQIGIWWFAARLVQLPTEPTNIAKYADQGFKVAVWSAVAWLCFRLVDVLSGVMVRASDKTETKLDDQLVPLIRKTLKVLITLTIAIMVVQNLGYSVTSLVASLGVGGLALALAAKDTVANLFGSVVVFTDRPFQIGDWVQFGGVEGTVEEVGFRTTRIRRFDKSEVTVPNATFSSQAIVNHSRRPMRRITMNVGITYESKAADIRGLLGDLRELVSNHPGLDDGFSFVHFVGFGDSSLNLQIYCFTKSVVWTEFLAAREELMLEIMEIVEARGLEMAFPTQTVYLRDEQWPEQKKSA